MKIEETEGLANMVKFMDTLRDIRKVMINLFLLKVKEHNFDVTIEMLEVLYFLWKKDYTNQQEIAEKTNRNKASLTSLIDNLTSRGLVTRKQNPDDRRNNLIILTKEGIAYRAKLMPIFEEVYASLNAAISSQELESTNQVLQKIYQKIK